MARTIYCKLDEHHNSDVSVNGVTFHIDDKGMLTVPDDVAAKLLGNKAKYIDPDAPEHDTRRTPGKRALPAQPILVEKNTGRELAPSEVDKIMGVQPEQQPTAPVPPAAPEKLVKAEKEEPPPKPEPAPEEWPPVSLAMHKPELLAVLKKLVKAGAEVEYSEENTKKELLEKIERIYDSMK